MKKHIPKEKLSKKAKKALDQELRKSWAFNPITRKTKNQKAYDRKNSHWQPYDGGDGSFLMGYTVMGCA